MYLFHLFRARECLLDNVIGAINVIGQNARVPAQPWQRGNQFVGRNWHACPRLQLIGANTASYTPGNGTRQQARCQSSAWAKAPVLVQPRPECARHMTSTLPESFVANVALHGMFSAEFCLLITATWLRWKMR